MTRQVVLDTETTGLEVSQGHRVIEIGCVELVNRRSTGRTFHQYINPERAVDPGAMEVHGITDAFLVDKPRFAEIAADFLDFARGAELIIHNAPFDVGFLDAELARLGTEQGTLADCCRILDSLSLARQLHPGQKNNLDALCRRYQVDNSGREFHGALLDAQILAEVYLAMTGGQVSLDLVSESGTQGEATGGAESCAAAPYPRTRVLRAEAAELEAHERRLREIEQESQVGCLWLRTGESRSVSSD